MTKLSFTNYPNCHSGSRLDEFCARLLNFKQGGTYVDIGSAHSMYHNNSHYLDTQLGWRGLCVELDSQYNGSYADRKNCNYINGDATKIDYAEVFAKMGMPPSIDYLSLDVDVLDLDVVKLLPHDKYRFKIIGIEHDAYLYGDKYRALQREFLLSKDYELICRDVFVRHPDIVDSPFEDWYVDPSYFSDFQISILQSSSCYPEYIIEKVKRYYEQK